MKVPELLAPAGDFEKLKIAIHYGADAIYFGDSRFSLRGMAENFCPEELKRAVDYSRSRGVKSYVTLNIFPHNRDLPEIKEYVIFLKEVRPDAVIISDLGIFSIFKDLAPEIDIHISTQANITNIESARFWERLGAKRLVLSRELNVEEILEIRQNTSLELEIFVHGSICISYSGRCYISSFLNFRGANRGECTNSCRWRYYLMEEKRPNEYFPVFEDDRGAYILSSKDLCMIEHLSLLSGIGIDSFKIEGRMKGINYVAGVVKTYREAIDSLRDGKPYIVRERWLKELSMFSSRGYTTGMFFGKQPVDGYNFGDKDPYRMSHELVGIVIDVTDSKAKVALRNRLKVNDSIEFLTPGFEEISFKVEKIYDEEGLDIQSAKNEDIVFINAPKGIRPLDLIRRKRSFSERISMDSLSLLAF
jgi:putative protease